MDNPAERVLVLIQSANTFADAAATFRDAFLNKGFSPHLAEATAMQITQMMFAAGVQK
jgi:hypothetical protein